MITGVRQISGETVCFRARDERNCTGAILRSGGVR